MELLHELEQKIFGINEKNINEKAQQTIELFDSSFPCSFNFVISNLIYSAFLSHFQSIDIYFDYLKLVQTKEEEMNKNNLKIIEIFAKYISNIKSQEAYYLINNMIRRNLVNVNITNNINSKYFAHYKTKSQSKMYIHEEFYENFLKHYKELSKNDWELHKQYVKEGVNPNEIAKIIRKDEVEKLQEITSQTKFDFDQTIEPSLYERCSFINQKNVTLIDYAAFFGSIRCFKYLLINGANVHFTGQYAVAGGIEEIIHLCEQNHSNFFGAYIAAIEYHRNDIFKYIYEKNLERLIINLAIKRMIYYHLVLTVEILKFFHIC